MPSNNEPGSALMATWALKFSVPKKNVKATVSSGNGSSISLGTLFHAAAGSLSSASTTIATAGKRSTSKASQKTTHIRARITRRIIQVSVANRENSAQAENHLSNLSPRAVLLCSSQGG
jgi:hypothetical protein